MQNGPSDRNHRKIIAEDFILINFIKDFNDFSYILPNSSFREQV